MGLKSFAYRVRYVMGKFQLDQDYGNKLPPLPVCELAAHCLNVYFIPCSYIQKMEVSVEFECRTYIIGLVRLREEIFRVNVSRY